MNSNYVTSKILRLCAQPRTFDYLSLNMDGLDPTKLHHTLKDLEGSRKIQKKDDLWVITEKAKHPTLEFIAPDPHLYLKKYMGYFDFLKTPHPLDFEWRNSTASLNYLNSLVQELNTIHDKILYLGMPTLFATACIKDIPHRVTLIERNNPIVKGLSTLIPDDSRFKIMEEDIFKVTPKKVGKHHCVIMDPPWYSPVFYQFMWLAAQCVEVGGIVGISLPPINTKDDILDERMDWISFCHAQGLCLEKLYPQKLHYAMPFFEFNAFRAGGIKNVQPFWRKGDLAVFKKITERTTTRPNHNFDNGDWEEIEIQTVRIRVRKDGDKKGKTLKIQNLVKTDILPSVSKSEEKRKQANVWTSGNRIYKVNNPELFLSLLREVKDGQNWLKKSERIVADFVEQVTSL